MQFLVPFRKEGIMVPKLLRLFAVVFIFLGLTACGGGGGGSTPPPPPPAKTHTVTIILGAGVHTPSTTLTVNDGADITIPFTLDANYSNLAVTGGNGTLVGLNYTLTKVSANVALNATATLTVVTHTVTIILGAGVHTPSTTVSVNDGSNVAIPFTLDAGYTNFMVNGVAASLNYVLTNVTADVTLNATATAPAVTHTVQVVAGTGILPLTQTSYVVNDGNTLTFNFKIDMGYRDPVVSGLGSTCSLYEVRIYQCTTAAITADGAITISATVDNRYALQYIRTSDNVLFANEFNTKPITVEARLTGTNFTPYIEYNAAALGTYPSTLVKQQLFDDGTHGDRVAGDGIYTAIVTLLPPAPSPLRYHSHTADWIRLDIQAYGGNGNQLTSVVPMGTNVNIGIIDPTQVSSSVQLPSGMYAGTNMINIVIPNLSDGFDHEQEVMQQVYSVYSDGFDAVALLYVGNTRAYNGFVGNWPHSDIVKITESGLGVALRDLTSTYGSAGKLQTIVSLDYDISASTFLHEFSHRWGFYLNDARLKLADSSGFHERAPSTLVGQLGGGYYLQQQSNGDFLVTDRPDADFSVGDKYADWELYLMGFLDPASVGPERFVLDATVPQSYGTIIPSASTTLVPIAGASGSSSVVGIYGTRVPDVAGSQHTFKVLFVAVSERPLTSAETSLVNRDAVYYGSQVEGQDLLYPTNTQMHTMPTFWSATKYMGSMDTTVPAPK